MAKAEKREEIRRLAVAASSLNVREKLDKDLDAIRVRLKESLNGSKNLLVFGAGNCGKMFAHFAQAEGYTIEGFLDRNADNISQCMGLPVYKENDARLSEDFRKNTLVVLTPVLPDAEKYDKIEMHLKSLGYARILNMRYFLGLRFMYDNTVFVNRVADDDRGAFVRELDVILSAFDLMADEHSRDLFVTMLRLGAELAYDIPAQSPGTTQYVDVNVNFRHHYRHFVDCGAFTGDTLSSLIQRHTVERYFGFEPGQSNYAKLSQTADSLRKKLGQAVLFPMGVSDQNEFLRFAETSDSIGRITETGETIVQTVRLDDVLKGHNALMIKMDIEGMEIAALQGAKRIITETKPDLAICVYHKASDLWRIPMMLKTWAPDYTFYLRSHFAGWLETVLYATVPMQEMP
ncbi:MAG: FkbM family methyltransferase [Phycisphaerales bacterium]|nr:FkbM family methyltransferase [Phycisphaerales bacterium]